MSDLSPVLDLRRLALLRPESDEPPGEESFASLVESFIASARSTSVELRQAADAGDTSAVAALAHRLKGASALYGAIRLRDACGRVQSAASLDPPETQELLASIEALPPVIDVTAAALEEELGR